MILPPQKRLGEGAWDAQGEGAATPLPTPLPRMRPRWQRVGFLKEWKTWARLSPTRPPANPSTPLLLPVLLWLPNPLSSPSQGRCERSWEGHLGGFSC